MSARGAAAAPGASAEPGAGGPQTKISAQVFADKAFEHFYSLELDQSVALYKKALELEPENHLHWTSLADAYLFQHLLAAGKLDSRLYSASNDFLREKTPDPNPAIVQQMKDALDQARKLAEARLTSNPRDTGALYALGLASAIEANYHFSFTRKYLDALRAGSKARDYHQKLREIDPANHDANLLIGVNEYAIGSIPASVRWLMYLAGYSGSKERGVQLIQDALLHGKRTSVAALTLLALIYNREKMYSFSREMLQHLLRFYPRNYLFEMEMASSFRREGNRDAAIETYKSVAHKMETSAAGYERVDADRIYFQIASLLDQQGRHDDALVYYEKLVTGTDSAGALLAQSYFRMGEIYLAARQREKARTMYEKAGKLPFPEVQRQASERLRSL